MIRDLLAPDNPHAAVAIETTAAGRIGDRPEAKPQAVVFIGLP